MALSAAVSGILSCSRSNAGGLRRIVIPPSNILIDNPASLWLSLAVPLVINQDLTPAPDAITSIVNNQSGAYTSGNALALYATVEEPANRIELQLELRSAATERNVQIFSVDKPRGQLLDALDSVAKQINAHATPFPTRSEPALEAFTTAVSSPETGVKVQRLRDAIEADPSFGLAYVTLLETLARTGDPQAGDVMTRAEAHRASFSALDCARLELVRAHMEHAALAKQIVAANNVLKLTPHDLNALAGVAEALFLQGHAGEGERVLARAIEISPESQDLRRRLALGLLENGQFSRAAEIWVQLPPEPAALFDGAIALLLGGDAKRAAAVYERFLETVGNADVKRLLRARWQALSGRRAEAVKDLQSAQFSDARVAALGKSEMTLWQVQDKQFKAAQVSARGAGIETELLAAGASSASAWRNKIQSLPATIASPDAKNLLLRYGYFLFGFYPEAAEIWRDTDRNSGGADLQARTMLAASLRGAGRQQQARKIPIQAFVPDPGDAFSVVSFSQLRSLLAQAE